MEGIFEGHIQCHEHYAEDLWEQLFGCAGISGALCCLMYQMPFIYQNSRHFSVHCVWILEMKLLYIKIQRYQKAAVTFISPGLQEEGGQLDMGGGGAPEGLDLWRKYCFGEFSRNMICWACFAFYSASIGWEIRWHVSTFSIEDEFSWGHRSIRWQICPVTGKTSLLPHNTGVETTQKNT